MKFIDLGKQQSFIKEKINQRISKVLEHGKYIMGPEVYELEEKLANYVDAKFCLTCSSGTDALLIPLMAKGIGPGDAVITTAFSYIATAEVIKLVGAEPIFLDVDPETFNLNPEFIPLGIRKAYEKGLNPKAIIPVDLFGQPANYNEICKYALKYDLFVLEDAAQSFGGEINNKKTCTFGDVSSTSFFPAKPLGCYGDGGAIFTNNKELYKVMKSIRVHGEGVDKYDNVRLGLNGRLDTIQAAILLEKLSIFSEEIIKRNIIADYYTSNMLSCLKRPYVPKNYISSWAQYSLVTKSEDYRNQLLLFLESNKIPATVYYRFPLHMQPVFKYLGYKKGDFPVSEELSRKIFSIPMHPYLAMDEQDLILNAFSKFDNI